MLDLIVQVPDYCPSFFTFPKRSILRPLLFPFMYIICPPVLIQTAMCMLITMLYCLLTKIQMIYLKNSYVILLRMVG